ncbi:beta-ketoacyl synthase N-terminal-like domain-containing protein [Kitasatospora sp. P5_F3]
MIAAITGLGTVTEEFDPAEHLGRRGWRHLPRAAQAALVAARLVLADAGRDGSAQDAGRTGVAIGTNFAVAEVADRIDFALLAGGVREISPLDCPNFSVNLPASQVSIAHGLAAFNVTLLNLFTAGAEALWFAADALRHGRADAVVAGAIEGPTGSAPEPVAAGACLLHLERPADAAARGARVHGYLAGGAQRLLPDDPARAAGVLAEAVHRVTGTAAPDEVLLSLPTDRRTDWVAEAMTAHFPAAAVTTLHGAPQASVTGVARLAATLGRLPARGLLFGTAGPQGHLVLLRLVPGP